MYEYLEPPRQPSYVGPDVVTAEMCAREPEAAADLLERAAALVHRFAHDSTRPTPAELADVRAWEVGYARLARDGAAVVPLTEES